MHEIVVFLLPPNLDDEPEILTIPSPDGFTPPPLRIRRPIISPDGELVEIWERWYLADERTATYRLTRIETPT